MIKRIAKIAAMTGLFALVVGVSAYLTMTWIVKGQETVVVPDLREKDLVHVLEILTDLGLNAKVRQLEYSPTVPQSRVIYQDPAAGDEIKKGRDVRIVISKGPKTVFTPNLARRSVPQGTIILEENGLCRGRLSETYNGRFEKGQVMAQEPPPGTLVNRTACVNLLVSLGRRPKAHLMPDLTGLKIEAAFQKIEALDMVVGDISTVSEPNRGPDTVVRQSPPPGHRATEGSQVDLLVNRMQAPGSPEGRLPGPRVLFRYRAGHGFLNRQLRVLLTGFGRPVVLFDDFVKPSTELWFLAPQTAGAEVLFFENNERTHPRGGRQLTGTLLPQPR